MPIDEEQLLALTETADIALQEIQNICGITKVAAAKVRFPRGFIRPAREAKTTLPLLGTEFKDATRPTH